MSIVELGPDDWQEFRAIRLRALGDAPEAFGRTLAEFELEDEQTWRPRLAAPNPILVLRSAGDVVAMGGGLVPPDETDVMFIWGMWTAPEARGNGHGRSLVTWLLDWARTRSIPTVELHVAEGNDSARRLYESCGFVGTGEWEPLREGSDTRIELLRRTTVRPAGG